jgi:glycosyltransferase involved in cell wall biosynthesis
MRIGYVAEPYEESHASGMGYVIVELLRQLAAKNTDHTLIVYSSKPINRSFVSGEFENVLVPRSFFGKLLWFSRLKDVDVLIHMVALLPLWVPKRVKTLLLCQELADQHVPSTELRQKLIVFMRDTVLMPRCVRRSSKIVAASEATKKDIQLFYKVPAEKIVVAPDGFQDLRDIGIDASVITEEMKPYFLFAGKVKLRKNVHSIVSAFVRFRERTGAKCSVVIAGDYGGDYYHAMQKELAEHNMTNSVHFIGYITGPQLHALYVNSLAFVFPSLSEGFGMPLAEAMSLGVPVITSNISAMPEVVGEAGLFVDPHSPEDISRAMERIFTDGSLRAEMIQKGLEQVKKFSWSKAADCVLEQIHQISHVG